MQVVGRRWVLCPLLALVVVAAISIAVVVDVGSKPDRGDYRFSGVVVPVKATVDPVAPVELQNGLECRELKAPDGTRSAEITGANLENSSPNAQILTFTFELEAGRKRLSDSGEYEVRPGTNDALFTFGDDSTPRKIPAGLSACRLTLR